MSPLEFGTRFSETATGVATATATHAASAGKTYYITEVSGSANLANLATASMIQVFHGTTVLWQDRMPNTGTCVSVYLKTFNTPLRGDTGSAVSVAVGSAISVSTANIAGIEL